MSTDFARIRREAIRWMILMTLNNARPNNAKEGWVLSVVLVEYPDSTPMELRRELDYLEGRELVKITRLPSGPWVAELTRFGTDIAEYTIDCEPGIARPVKYW